MSPKLKLPPELGKSLSKFSRLLANYNRLIFFILSISVLIYAIISLNLTLNAPSDEEYRAERGNPANLIRFDEDTIKLINSLNSGQKTDSEALPGGRINPFSE